MKIEKIKVDDGYVYATAKKTRLGYRAMIVYKPFSTKPIVYVDKIDCVYREDAIYYANRELQDALRYGRVSW